MYNNNSILFKRKKLFSENDMSIVPKEDPVPVIEQSPTLNTVEPCNQSDIITVLLIILQEYHDIFWYLLFIIVLNFALKTILLAKREFFDT